MEAKSLNAGVVLVIDDDVDVLTSIQHLLECEGYRVLAVADPRQGVQTYIDHWQEVQVVVLDYQMHCQYGDELLERLQQINAAVRAIMVTGSVEEAGRRFEGHGLFGLLQKPFSPAEFLSLVGSAMSLTPARDLKPAPSASA